jgi:hypothetical protein
VRDYLNGFDLMSIALYHDGRLGVTRDPVGAETAWWCAAVDAGRVIKRANSAKGKDVPAAAQALKVVLTEHRIVLARAGAAAQKIQAGVEWARRNGVLSAVNSEYRRRQLAAKARGERRRQLPRLPSTWTVDSRRDRTRLAATNKCFCAE